MTNPDLSELSELYRLLELETLKSELGLEQFNHGVYANERAEYLSLKSKLEQKIKYYDKRHPEAVAT